MGLKFRRQYPCGPFILDFYCASENLAVELDGGQHFDPVHHAYDQRRTAFLHRHGIRVLRFPNDVVFREREAVLEAILLATTTALPIPSPRLRGEGIG